jgi:putative FmdB family regulatory protein
MPMYVFSCRSCGRFEVSRPMAEASSGASCPSCHRAARRVFTSPGITRLARPLRRAMDVEEASAHEPPVTTQKQGRPMPQRGSPVPPWILH